MIQLQPGDFVKPHNAPTTHPIYIVLKVRGGRVGSNNPTVDLQLRKNVVQKRVPVKLLRHLTAIERTV